METRKLAWSQCWRRTRLPGWLPRDTSKPMAFMDEYLPSQCRCCLKLLEGRHSSNHEGLQRPTVSGTPALIFWTNSRIIFKECLLGLNDFSFGVCVVSTGTATCKIRDIRYGNVDVKFILGSWSTNEYWVVPFATAPLIVQPELVIGGASESMKIASIVTIGNRPPKTVGNSDCWVMSWEDTCTMNPNLSIDNT